MCWNGVSLEVGANEYDRNGQSWDMYETGFDS